MTYSRENPNPRIKLPVPEGLSDEVLVALEQGLVLCICRARYSKKLIRCPSCGEPNPWRELKPTPLKRPPGLFVNVTRTP